MDQDDLLGQRLVTVEVGSDSWAISDVEETIVD